MLNINVKGQQAYASERSIIVSDAVNYVKAQFTFDSDWNGYDLTYQFTNGSLTYNVISNSTEILIPHETLIPGELIVKVFGTIVSGTTITKRITMMPISIQVIDSSISSSESNSSNPTATEIEQLNAKIEALETGDTEALETANTALTNSQTAISTANTANTNFTDHLNNYYGNSGIITPPTLTINGDATISLSSGKYATYSDSNFTLPISQYTPADTTLTLTNNSLNYVVFNGATHAIEVTTDRSGTNYSNVIIILTVYREGTTLNIIEWGDYSKGLADKLLKRFVRTSRFERESGLALSENTGRIIQIASGIVWYGAEYLSLDQALSSDTCYQWYHASDGSWTKSLVTQYNNTQYDSGTGLVTLSNTSRYAVNWIFRGIKDAKLIHIVLGRGNYTQTQAINEQVPALPPLVSSEGMLVGKIIVQYTGTSAYSISSAFDKTFTAGDSFGADNISVADAGGYFTGTNVESVLQEIGAKLATL